MSPTNDNSESSKTTAAKAKARQAKKPRDMPSRPLSAYNFFFRSERAKILEEREEEARRTGQTQDKSDLFAILGKTIAARWKNVSDENRKKYRDQAADDMKRYRAEMDQYHESIAKSIRVDNKEGGKKSSKKSSKKAAAADDGSSAKGSPAVKSSKSKNSPRHSAASDPSAGAIGTPKGSMAGQPPNLAAMGAANPNGMGPGAAFGGVGPGSSLEMLSYQNLLRQRELAALREQSMGIPGGLGQHAMLRGGMGAGLGGPGLGYMDRLGAAGAGPSAALLGSSAGFGLGGGTGLLQGYPGAAGYPGLDVEVSARSGLSPEEQLFLLRRNQEEAELSVRQRLELMQQQRQMQDPSLAMMQERQRLLERQRLEQLLSGMGGPAGAPGGF